MGFEVGCARQLPAAPIGRRAGEGGDPLRLQERRADVRHGSLLCETGAGATWKRPCSGWRPLRFAQDGNSVRVSSDRPSAEAARLINPIAAAAAPDPAPSRRPSKHAAVPGPAKAGDGRYDARGASGVAPARCCFGPAAEGSRSQIRSRCSTRHAALDRPPAQLTTARGCERAQRQGAITVAAERHQLVRVRPNEGKSDITRFTPGGQTPYPVDRALSDLKNY